MEADRYYEAARIAGRSRMAHQIIQSIIGEADYVGIPLDYHVERTLENYHEQNGLPYDLLPDDVYQLYVERYRDE